VIVGCGGGVAGQFGGLHRGVARSGGRAGPGQQNHSVVGFAERGDDLGEGGCGPGASGRMGVGPQAQMVAGVGAIEPVRTLLLVLTRSAPCRGETAGVGAFG
jgi:hypothetical protein